MSEPITFTSASARFALPFLFAGQAQKEFFVNEAHARADILFHPSVEGEQAAPPATFEDGQCWLVADEAQGEWAGNGGAIAGRQASRWVFVQPRDGMQIFDKQTGQKVLFLGGWQRVSAPELPTSGTVIDTEVRAALGNLIETLRNAGIFSAI